MWDWAQVVAADGGESFRWGFTAASPGGSSAGPFQGGNVSDHVGDRPAAVAANRAAVAHDLGLDPSHLLFMTQVHGVSVDVVDGPRDAAPPPADAMVTTRPGLALGVLVADCVPILLAAPHQGVVGVAHAGRQGLARGVVEAVVRAMQELGARSIQAVVGPSVCGRCYEVPEELRREVAEVCPLSATMSWTGTPALDIAAGVVEQLVRAGVSTSWRPGCTRESDHLFSYRRSGVTGRFAGVVVLGDGPAPVADRAASGRSPAAAR
ncbi:MAG: peptidoglycan editing factor PgeF [Dermatophilaceae bacterium]